jgi:hypothetical protein
VDHQPVGEQLQADRLVPGVEVGRQLAGLYRVRDSRGERFLQPSRGVIGGGGEAGYHGTLAAAALAWGPYAIDPDGRPAAALVIGSDQVAG